MSEATPVIEVAGLRSVFGRQVVHDGLDLEVRRGEVLGVIGRSGAGKSTLLRLVNRLIEPSEGRIRFAGAEVTALKGAALLAWRADCAMIFQQFNLVNRLDVITNVLVGRCGHKATLPTLFKAFTADERAKAVRVRSSPR